ncbi:Phosphoheptose isomerase [Prochlorococcus marinus str. MIT 9321]|uniref:Phosphoheptose isomerase n=1 Tax=Prochlorococcus marinus str. MIT 9401 TaxID=167551 RepID=A0A0A2BCN7_PROMR|nr:SIS domain-containing protein [Prochlorococcus marinus]KGG02853.1 Phosphoheptose isomerase [Prochlorococcus marinus str. MIT 9321]KGG05476.1 Phosphoheptose isomerase [Prochlorococcus marinus str. MIT 9322]KGG10510.1 Phosphoheptose isomerase [Prochlorococcus marinus str. MIT 9401]
MYKAFYKSVSEGCSDKDIQKISELAKKVINTDGKFLFAGNGGSMAISCHISAELTGRFIKDRPPIKSYVLGSNLSSTTAIANDYSFSDIFLRDLGCFLEKEDLVILMSTSGKSKNILDCINYLKEKEHFNSIILTGKTSNIFSPSLTHIQSPSTVTARVQEHHLFLLHEMCNFIDNLF